MAMGPPLYIGLFLFVTTPPMPMTTIAFVSPIHNQVQQQPLIAPKHQHVVYRRKKSLELPYLVEEMDAPTMYTSPAFFNHDVLAGIFDRRLSSSTASPSAAAILTSATVEHIWDDILTHGTKTHLYNALLSLAIPLLLFGKMIPFLSSYLSGHPALLSVLILEGSFLGLVIDNMINASGRYVGEGLTLRRLTRVRLALHGLSIPSCFIPVIELGKRSKLFSNRVSNIGMGIWLSYAFAEFIGWVFLYDINELKVVDNRNIDSCDHHPRYMKGTLVSLFINLLVRCNSCICTFSSSSTFLYISLLYL